VIFRGALWPALESGSRKRRLKLLYPLCKNHGDSPCGKCGFRRIRPVLFADKILAISPN